MPTTTFTLADESFTMLKSSQLTFAEARLYEQVTGYQYGPLLRGVNAGSAATTQAFMWLSMRRVKPEIKFSDLDSLSMDDIETKVEADATKEAEEAADPTEGEDSQPNG